MKNLNPVECRRKNSNGNLIDRWKIPEGEKQVLRKVGDTQTALESLDEAAKRRKLIFIGDYKKSKVLMDNFENRLVEPVYTNDVYEVLKIPQTTILSIVIVGNILNLKDVLQLLKGFLGPSHKPILLVAHKEIGDKEAYNWYRLGADFILNFETEKVVFESLLANYVRKIPVIESKTPVRKKVESAIWARLNVFFPGVKRLRILVAEKNAYLMGKISSNVRKTNLERVVQNTPGIKEADTTGVVVNSKLRAI